MPERKLEEGVLVFDSWHVDYVGAMFSIDPKDEIGIALFKEFCAKLYEHYRANPNLVNW